MGTLRQAVVEFDGISIQSDEKLKSITNLITQILEKEKQEVQEKIKHEESHVEKVQERLKNLQNNSNNSGPVNVVSTDGNTLAKLWREFDFRRTGAVGELISKTETADTSVTASISEDDSKYLRRIADLALDFCCKEYEKQQEELGRALSYCPKENDLSIDQREAAKSFQSELEADVTHHLLKKLKDKEKIVAEEKERVEQYLKSCVDVSWYVQVHYKGAKFVWNVPEKPTKESFICITSNCKKGSTCERRVCRPALNLNGRILNPGKYSCVSCIPDNKVLDEKQNTTKMQGSMPRTSSASNTPSGEGVTNQPEGQSKGNMKEAKKDHSHEKKKGSPKDEKSTPKQKKGQGLKDKGEDSKSTEKIKTENKNSLDF